MREFKGRVVVPGTATAEALVSKQGFNTLASFKKALLAKKLDAPCSDQNNEDIYQKNMAKKALCLPQTIGSTTGGIVIYCASKMGASPACLLFSESIDSLAAAGAILSDIWTDAEMPTVDRLGQDFLDYVKDGMTINIKEDGLVEVE
ncbi:MAG: DUF126 domain-containing protein [Peptostreptococcaceae bacterium]|nr:DUF126 domain-containing protein [Peptostreptococcaceae bacterium]